MSWTRRDFLRLAALVEDLDGSFVSGALLSATGNEQLANGGAGNNPVHDHSDAGWDDRPYAAGSGGYSGCEPRIISLLLHGRNSH